MKRASSPTNNLEKYQPKKRKNRRSGFAGIAGSRIPSRLSETPLDLTVFGHRCKIHSDDEMAKQIDEGKHLIDYFGGDQGQGLSPRQGIVGEYAADREEEEQQQAKQKQHLHLHLQQQGIHVPYMENLEEDLFGNSSSLKQDAERPILLDRYDVRTLLDNLEELEKPAGIHSGTDSRKFSLQIKEHKLETLSHEYENENGYDGYGDDDILDEETRRVVNGERYSDLNILACVEGDQIHVETIHSTRSIGSNEQKQTPPDGSDMNDLKECTSGVELEGQENINIHVLAPNGVKVVSYVTNCLIVQ